MSIMQRPLVDGGVIERLMRNKQLHRNLCPVPSRSYSRPGKETPISKNAKFDIEAQGAFINIEKSSISGYNEIEVLNFDIDVFSISCRVDIKVPDFDTSIDVSSISNCVDIEVPHFDIEDSLISY